MDFGTPICHPSQILRGVGGGGGDGIITNLAKGREPGIEIIERTPKSRLCKTLTLYLVFIYLQLKGMTPSQIKIFTSVLHAGCGVLQ